MRPDLPIVAEFLALLAGGALLIGTAPYLFGRTSAFKARELFSRHRIHLTVRVAYVVGVVLFVLDAWALGALCSLPFEKPRPMFAEPDHEPSGFLLLLTLVGMVVGLGVTTSVARESPASLKKYFGILAVASLMLLMLTAFATVVVGLKSLG
jgi:hypothetical protein